MQLFFLDLDSSLLSLVTILPPVASTNASIYYSFMWYSFEAR